MKVIFAEVFLFYVRVINKMKMMCCTFILKNVINCTDESRTASSVNRYTRNKYIFHTKPNTFFSNIYNTLAIRSISPSTLRMPFAEQQCLFRRFFRFALAENSDGSVSIKHRQRNDTCSLHC